MVKTKEYYRLYKEISWLGKLQEKRHPMHYRKIAMKILMAFMYIFMIGYLFFIGCMLKAVLQTARPGMEPYNLFNEGMFFLLLVDMLLRFMGQDTPAAKVRPFLLLPVSRKMVTDCYLIRVVLTPLNMAWMALLVPFAAKAVFPFYGFAGSIGYLCGWWLLIVLNCYFYLLTRTLIMRNILWLALPAAVYFIPLLFVFLPDIHFMGYFFMYLGEGWMKGHVWSYLLVMAGVAGIFLLNRKVQMKAILLETTGNVRTESRKSYSFSVFSWLDRFGLTGEFIKMEIKSALRNKTVRSQIIMLLVETLLFSIFITTLPDAFHVMGTAFLCYYCFYMFSTPLLHTLSAEGNYMDGLMVHKQLLRDLLKGKYIYYCLLELIALVLLIPAITTGTVTLLFCIACFLVAIGFCLPISMQIAAYTNYAMPLNKKLTEGGSNGHIGMTSIWMFIVFAFPVAVQYFLTVFISETVSYVALCIIGLAGFLTQNIWIGALYKRIRSRRYRNMEGFRDSRQS